MASTASPRRAPADELVPGRTLRVAFLGPQQWLEGCAPPQAALGLLPRFFAAQVELSQTLASLERFAPMATVIFDPLAVPDELLAAAPGITLGVLVGDLPSEDDAAAFGALDRLVSFRPALTGAQIGARGVWRAVPPPVSDLYFGEVRPLHSRPRAMSVGRSTAHREAMLLPAKHHHDLLQVIHGVSGRWLAELLAEYDVGVYVAREPGGGFGAQVGMHLAAGQLLLAEALDPTHGLERDIDYLQISSPDALVYMLDRLARFPEMHQRVRVRGRMKAEQFRASTLFARLLRDLLADVATFGR